MTTPAHSFDSRKDAPVEGDYEVWCNVTEMFRRVRRGSHAEIEPFHCAWCNSPTPYLFSLRESEYTRALIRYRKCWKCLEYKEKLAVQMCLEILSPQV